MTNVENSSEESVNQASGVSCDWPLFPRAAQFLKTTDEGKCDRNLAAQFGGDCENFHWLGLLGDPVVLKESGGKFKMWFTSGEKIGVNNWRAVISYAESTDGLLWEDPKDLAKDAVPVLSPGTSGVDEEGVETAYVLQIPQGYAMYFSGARAPSPNINYVIGRATSGNGKNWIKDSQPTLEFNLPWEMPFDAGGYQVGGVLEPSVLFDGQTYHLWYQGFGRDGLDAPAYARFGYATSQNGKDWVKSQNPVFRGKSGDFDVGGVGHVNVVRAPNGVFHMFYVGIGDGDILKIGHAKSSNGILWERNPNNPIIEGRAGEWDEGLVGGPSALFVGNELFLYYMGSRTQDFAGVRFARTQAVCP